MIVKSQKNIPDNETILSSMKVHEVLYIISVLPQRATSDILLLNIKQQNNRAITI